MNPDNQSILSDEIVDRHNGQLGTAPVDASERKYTVVKNLRAAADPLSSYKDGVGSHSKEQLEDQIIADRVSLVHDSQASELVQTIPQSELLHYSLEAAGHGLIMATEQIAADLVRFAKVGMKDVIRSKGMDVSKQPLSIREPIKSDSQLQDEGKAVDGKSEFHERLRILSHSLKAERDAKFVVTQPHIFDEYNISPQYWTRDPLVEYFVELFEEEMSDEASADSSAEETDDSTATTLADF